MQAVMQLTQVIFIFIWIIYLPSSFHSYCY